MSWLNTRESGSGGDWAYSDERSKEGGLEVVQQQQQQQQQNAAGGAPPQQLVLHEAHDPVLYFDAAGTPIHPTTANNGSNNIAAGGLNHSNSVGSDHHGYRSPPGAGGEAYYDHSGAGAGGIPPGMAITTPAASVPRYSEPGVGAGYFGGGGAGGGGGYPADKAMSLPDRAAARRKPNVLGLSPFFFWVMVLVIFVIVAIGLAVGLSLGLNNNSRNGADVAAAASPSSSSDPSSSSSSGTPTSSSSSPSSSSQPANGPVPSDGGCPAINSKKYTPYAVDGQAIPLGDSSKGGSSEPQEFQQQCYTNWVANGTDHTHDIMRIFMPTLENCMMACAEYNYGYRNALRSGAGVGGGYCVAVSIAKEEAGFCYLKNATVANDTMGRPGSWSSGVLLTDLTGKS